MTERLYPSPGREVGSIYEDLELPAPVSADLPYITINMVASVDGRSSTSGRAAGIGGAADRLAMRELRARVDAVMVGAGTLRAEKLNLGLDDRRARQPLAVVVGGSGPLPLRARLVVENPQDVLLVIPEGAPSVTEEIPARVNIHRAPSSGPGRVDLRALLKTLRKDHGVERLLVEGGPSLNRALIDEDLPDELFLTVAPKLISDDEAAIVRGDGPTRAPCNLVLLSVHRAGDELFLRYRFEEHP